jgi:hypothetical protein
MSCSMSESELEEPPGFPVVDFSPFPMPTPLSLPRQGKNDGN